MAPDEPLYGLEPPDLAGDHVITQLFGSSWGESDCMKFAIDSPGTELGFEIHWVNEDYPIEYILL